MNDNKITVYLNKKALTAARGEILAAAIGLDAPCGGHGKCGKCKVIATGMLSPVSDAERAHLTEQELKDNVRLACHTLVLGDCTVTAYQEVKAPNIVIGEEGITQPESPVFGQFAVALDIGTTTLAARLYTPAGEVLATCGRLNPQSRFGADVISRIEASMKGEGKTLSALICAAIDGMVRELADTAGIDALQIDALCITGNTVMLYLLTASDPEALSHAPFAADQLFGEQVSAKALGLTALRADATVLLPPCISSFVGADTVCALLSTSLCEGKESALMVDIGTNGEIALWHDGKLTVCSTAAGPAFEGAGISMGMRGELGAIDRVSLYGDKLIAHVIGEVPPKGICGSGLVDAAACLLELELVDETGYMENEREVITAPVSLTAEDIRMLQLAKSAICAGVTTALNLENITPEQLKSIFVAGGFGRYLNPESAARIGLLPCALCKKMKAVGNAALDGAAMLLLCRDALAKAQKLAQSATVLELSTSAVFAEQYMSGMMLQEC
ncbi:MAG: DUF4445 domain-containing protein [Clostridia bacterium]|nr:DUF4445 domain-containing protein [Clostridia bacterium]